MPSEAINPLDLLAREKTGTPFLYPFQKLVVANCLEGRSQIVILPTGAGKSLCFQLPAQLLPGATLVVFPLRSLLADQLRRLRERDVPCASLQGGQPPRERDRLWRSLAAGEIRLLLTTPEAALSPGPLERLRSACISHLVVDEAHCVAEWGDTFRPSYLQLGLLRDAVGAPILSAFTATASPYILRRLADVLFPKEDYNLVRAIPDRPNIRYTVLPSIAKERTLTELVRTAERPALIFCRTRPSAELTARLLRARLGGEEISFYHAGLEPEEKRSIEQWFFSSQTGVLAATCAYGMGVDKPDIRTVIHRDVPPSVEAFLQESGRAGRDRLPASSYLILAREDLLRRDRADGTIEQQRFAALVELAKRTDRCRREALLALLDAEPEVCFGCDVCDRRVVEHAEGEKLLVGFVRRSRRRYTPSDATHVLAGRLRYEVGRRRLYPARGWGALGDWESEDIETALADLVAAGRLRLPRRGPWAGRLTVGASRSSGPCPRHSDGRARS